MPYLRNVLLLFDVLHLGDRSHTIERQYNSRTKEGEEHQEFINLDDSEWCQCVLDFLLTLCTDTSSSC